MPRDADENYGSLARRCLSDPRIMDLFVRSFRLYLKSNRRCCTSQKQQFFTAIRCTEIKGSLKNDPDINRKPGSGTASLVVPTEECT